MNQLKVNQQETILTLHGQGWSKRRIARELGVDRLTVRRAYAGYERDGWIVAAFWNLAGDDSSVYLLGSVPHIGRLTAEVGRVGSKSLTTG
jgi:hypothetical protein